MTRSRATIYADLARLYLELAAHEEPGASSAPARTASAPARSAPTTPSVASDADLDSQYGDPKVKRDPNQKHWDGPSFVDAHYSECPSDYLIALAGFLEWTAKRNDEKAAQGDDKAANYATYDRRDAARARGWAKRNEGRARDTYDDPGPPDDAPDFGADSDIPF